jgi:hypothetical protein
VAEPDGAAPDAVDDDEVVSSPPQAVRVRTAPRARAVAASVRFMKWFLSSSREWGAMKRHRT